MTDAAPETVALEYRIAALEREVDLTITERVAFLEKKIDLMLTALHNEMAAQDGHIAFIRDERWASHAAIHTADGLALGKATEALDARLEQMNQFRAQITDMTRLFATREMVEAALSGLTSRLDREATDTRSRFERSDAQLRAEVRPVQDARAGQIAVVAAIGFAVTIISIIIVVANFVTRVP